MKEEFLPSVFFEKSLKNDVNAWFLRNRRIQEMLGKMLRKWLKNRFF